MAELTRRTMLAALAGGVAAPVFANAPLTSPKPVARPAAGSGATAPVPVDPRAAAEALIAAAKLGGEVSFAVADMATGAIVAARGADRPMAPASTAKAITSLYALEMLGPGLRFGTRLLATGPVTGGRIEGDLILAGGGDPTLTTDDLGDLAAALAARGVRGVAGGFKIWAGALPFIDRIDRAQPDWLGYNPAVGGLNLNFNRVNFVWEQQEGKYQVGFDARAERFAPPVYTARMRVVARDMPVFTYAQAGTIDDWTVASGALGKKGSRWMPVRRPDLYAADVFQTLAKAQGIALPAAQAVDRLPEARALVAHDSAPLPDVLRGMLKYSTNMTAEAVGMAASLKRGIGDHSGSAAEMGRWLAARLGSGAAHFADHSGLCGTSRISAADMVAALRRLGPAAGLGGLMKDMTFRKAVAGGALPQRVMAKTGTLNFVSSLVGYFTTAAGEARVFAIFSGDLARRDALSPDEQENPPGLSGWLRRARRLQQGLIETWAA